MHIHMYACIILCNVLYIIYCILCIYIYISYIAHISCIYRVYMEKIILSHLNCRVLPITSQVSSEYPHPQWIWSHLLPLWCASSRGQSSSLRSSTKPPWLWTRNHQKTYVRAIWVCIYIYMCILSQAHQQKSLVHLVREPLEILGDIRRTNDVLTHWWPYWLHSTHHRPLIQVFLCVNSVSEAIFPRKQETSQCLPNVV